MRYKTLQDFMPIIKDREAGMTLQDIGDKLGVTRQRAEQIYQKGKQLQRTQHTDPFWGLSTRAVDTFARLGLRNRRDVKRAVKDKTLHPLSGLANYRWKTHNYVLAWLKLPEIPLADNGTNCRAINTCPKCGHQY